MLWREVFIVGSEPKLSTASPLAPDDSGDTTASPAAGSRRFILDSTSVLKMARSDNRLRRTIRYEAARIMAEEGIRDYRRAKEKACMRNGVSTVHSVPTNLEIEDSLAEQLSIFAKESVQELHRQYLETACTIMQLLRDYSPPSDWCYAFRNHYVLTPR